MADVVRRGNVTPREVGSNPSYHIRSRSVVVIALPCHGRNRRFEPLLDRFVGLYVRTPPSRGIHILGKVAQLVEHWFEEVGIWKIVGLKIYETKCYFTL